MTKAIYKRKHLIWGLLAVTEGESMIAMVGNVVEPGRLDSGAAAENFTSDSKDGGRVRLDLS